MTLSLGFGLWQAARALPDGNGRRLATAGAVLAILGEVSVIGVWASGLLIIGLSAFAQWPPSRSRVGVLVGSSLWLVLGVSGGRFDSDDSAPLTDVGRWLLTSGLLIIVVALFLWGLGRWNDLRRTRDGESVPAA